MTPGRGGAAMWSNAWKMLVVTVGLGVVLGVVSVNAQSSSAPADPARPAATAPGSGGMGDRHDGTAMPMMDMCRQMMAGHMMGGRMMENPMMGGFATGMTDDQRMDRKMMGHMVEMRGEMMKAMGDVMMKHGRMMGESATK